MGIFNLSKSDALRVVDVHHDFEFVDLGTDGLHIISYGAVLEGPGKSRMVYGINSDFFKTAVFRRMCEEQSEQNTWMFENVFKHIKVMIRGKLTTVTDARKQFAENATLSFAIEPDDQPVPKSDVLDVVVGNIDKLRDALVAAVDKTTSAKDKIVRQWCYYAAHDTVCFNNLFGGMMHKPDGWDNFAIDIRLLSDVFGQDHDDFNPEAKYPHHPLFDAMAQCATANKLRTHVLKLSSQRLLSAVTSDAKFDND